MCAGRAVVSSGTFGHYPGIRTGSHVNRIKATESAREVSLRSLVEFRILGPLELTADSSRLDLGGARQHIVVAALLLSANRVVTMDRLIEAIYGEDLPTTCRAQAQISISSLRRLF